MDIELLDEYIEFAQSLNVSTAAKSLYISQSTLSKHLKTLEENVGVPLIDRSSPNGLKLTKAGKVFLDACSTISHAYDSALERCHELSRDPKKITVLKPCTIDASTEFVYQLFRNMQRDHADTSVELLQMGGYSMIENLLLGRVDCATSHCNSPAQFDRLAEQGISFMPIFRDTIYIWIPTDSPLLEKEHLYLEDLIDIPIFVPASRAYADLHDWVKSLCAVRGFKPLLAYKDVDSMYDLMNSNMSGGVMLLTSEANVGDPAIELRSTMVLRKLEDANLGNTVGLAYLKTNKNPSLQTLIECIKNHTYPIFDNPDITDIIERDQ